jgi:hypothetical protein
MPLLLQYASSFERSCKHLDPHQRAIIARIIESLEIYYLHGCDIAKVVETEARFFYKKLRYDFYEAGVEGKLRVILKKNDSKCVALLAGNHDQIKRFLA